MFFASIVCQVDRADVHDRQQVPAEILGRKGGETPLTGRVLVADYRSASSVMSDLSDDQSIDLVSLLAIISLSSSQHPISLPENPT